MSVHYVTGGIRMGLRGNLEHKRSCTCGWWSQFQWTEDLVERLAADHLALYYHPTDLDPPWEDTT